MSRVPSPTGRTGYNARMSLGTGELLMYVALLLAVAAAGVVMVLQMFSKPRGPGGSGPRS